MKSKNIEQPFKPKVKDVLIALESEPQWLKLLNYKEESFKKLITVIEAEANKKEYEPSIIQSIKQLAELLDQTAAKISKMLFKLYDGIWELNETHPELFIKDGAFYTLYFRDSFEKQYVSFKMNITNPINIGERFEWMFLKGKFSFTYFHAESIDHNHFKGRVETTITFKNGLHNQYRELLLNKAQCLNEMLHLPEHKIDELLYHRVEKDLGGFPKTMEKEAAYFSKRKSRW
jgi:hypothetical protein